MDDRLRICEESLGSLGGSLKIGDAFGTHVGKVQMASQHLDKVIPGAIDRLCGIGNPEMELAAAFAQHPVIGHALNQGVMERDRSRGVVLAPVQETGFDQPAKAGLELRPVGRHRLQQGTAHHSPDDGPQLQGDRVDRSQTIEAGRDDAFDGRWYVLRLPSGDRNPVATPLRQHAGLQQRPNCFLYKERIP